MLLSLCIGLSNVEAVYNLGKVRLTYCHMIQLEDVMESGILNACTDPLQDLQVKTRKTFSDSIT